MTAKAVLIIHLIWAQTVTLQNVNQTQSLPTTLDPDDLANGPFDLENHINNLLKNQTQIQQQLQKSMNTIFTKFPELEKVNSLLENAMQTQQALLDSYEKQLHEKTERLRDLETNITELSVLFPTNCKEIKENGKNVSGIYTIKPETAPGSFEVWCDMETKNGGWIYVVNRFDGSQKFNLNWTDYKRGFGNVGGEFWLGLQHLFELTAAEPHELLIELTDWENNTVYENYKKFSIGDEAEGYALKTVRDYSGDVGNDFGAHEGMKFSTPDKSQDKSNAYCAGQWDAGWWYTHCYTCLLTGQYNDWCKSRDFKEGHRGINCFYFHGYGYSLQKVKMMVRPLTT